MKLIVGLGNPGKEYENTRHNVGFLVISNLKSQISKLHLKSQNFEYNNKFNSEMIETEYKKGKIILVKPQTYMNNSGLVAKKIMDYFKINERDLYVVCDDLDLPIGTIRVRQEGSSGGHKGLQSIIDQIGDNKFVRFRVGIGSNKKFTNYNMPAEKYVLQKFSKDEQKIMDKAIDKTVELVVESLETGIEEKTVNII